MQRLEALAPSVAITATDTDGNGIVSGGAAKGEVTFKFELAVKCNQRMKKLLNVDSVTHNCPDPKWFGGKKTYYLVCPYSEELVASVHVRAGTFRDDFDVPNTASATVAVLML